MAKKSYGDLKRQMEALMAQQQEMEQKAAKAFTDTILKDVNARAKLAELSTGELQAVARLFVSGVDGLIAQVQADKAAKTAAAEPPQDAAQAPVSAPVPQMQP